MVEEKKCGGSRDVVVFACGLPYLAWAIRQYSTTREITNNNEGELDKILDMLTHSYIKDGLWRTRSSLSWEVSISFTMVGKKRVITPRRSLLSVETMFRSNLSSRDLYYNTTIDIDSSSFTMPTEVEIQDKGRRNWLARSLVLLQTSWLIIQCMYIFQSSISKSSCMRMQP